MGKGLGYVFEMRDADRQHHSPRSQRFSVFETQEKSIEEALNARDQFLFERRHQAVAECEPISIESFEFYRNPGIAVLDPPLGAET